MRGCSICPRARPRRASPSWSSNSGSRTISIKHASDLPLGIRQRLSLAVAIVHEPEMLILDEPTSGVDPLARDRFWELLIDLSRNQGVTIFVSTHFMNEAERCDRISLMDSGRVLATDTPRESRRRRAAPPRWRTPSSAISKRPPARAAADDAAPSLPARRSRSQPRSRGAPQRVVQPAAPVRLHDPRNDRTAARSRSGWLSPCSAPRF